jgi:type VI secretion system ImpB/VipA family protein
MTARTTVPRSRITLTYDTRQPDQPRKEKELPLRLLIVGDLTGRAWRADPAPGAPPPPADELEDRPIHDLNGKNLDTILKKMNVAVDLTGVTNHAEKAGAPFDVSIPITSMASFEPGQVVKHVPSTQRLLRIRTLLLELQSCVDNNKQFRRLVRELTSPARAALLEEMRAAFAKEQAALRIPTAAELADAPVALPAAGTAAAAKPAPVPPTVPPAPPPKL